MKAFIITLKDHQLSESVSKDCQNQAIKFGVDIEIFDAVWGKYYKEHYVQYNTRCIYVHI